MTASGITAIIWDYDGTLVDTMHKNLAVTKIIISEITGKDSSCFPALTSISNYEKANFRAMNWREMYKREYGLNEIQTDEAGRLWTTYQVKNDIECPPYMGIKETLSALNGYPQGIFSQNSRPLIQDWLERNGMVHFFDSIVGYEEVTFANQKPAPLGLFLSIEALTNNKPGTVFFIGDLETDILCAQNAYRKFKQNGADIKVISVAIHHQNGKLINEWKTKPDHHLTDITELLDIVEEG